MVYLFIKKNLIHSGFYLKCWLLLAKFNFPAQTANKNYLNCTAKSWPVQHVVKAIKKMQPVVKTIYFKVFPYCQLFVYILAKKCFETKYGGLLLFTETISRGKICETIGFSNTVC